MTVRPITACGETSERIAAVVHGGVALIYLALLAWHALSAVRHWERR